MSKRRQKKQLRKLVNRRVRQHGQPATSREFAPKRGDFAVEALEPRVLLSAQLLPGGILAIIDQDGSDDTLEITAGAADGEVDLNAGLDVGDATSFTGVNGIFVDLGDGDDSVTIAADIVNVAGASYGVTLEGGNGADTLVGGVGDDTLIGGDGDDLVIGHDGDDLLGDNLDAIGNAGDDTYAFEDGWGADTIVDASGEDTIDMAGGLTGGALGEYGDDPATADVTFTIGSVSATDGGGNTITHAGDTIFNINGGDGDDSFVFEDGAALGDGSGDIDGGDGDDTIDYSAWGDSVTIDLTDGGSTGVTGIDSVETVIGGDGDDLITGDGGDGDFTGGDGADTIDGGDGSDTIDGEAGDDLIDGGDGIDDLTGGTGTNTLSFASSTGAATVDLSGPTVADDGFFNADAIDGTFANVIGSDQDDTITGDGDANVIQGGAGDDTIDGGGGNDTYQYLAGVALGDDDVTALAGDTFDFSAVTSDLTYDPTGDGGAGTVSDGADDVSGINTASGLTANPLQDNTLDFSGDTAAVTVDLAAGTATDGTVDLTTVSGFNIVIGSDQDDTITGDGNDNTLTGGDGDDTMAGGAGNDTYLFDDGWGDDVVTDAGGTIDLFDFSDVGDNPLTFAVGSLTVDDGVSTVTTASDVIDQLIGGTDAAGDTLDYSGVATAVSVDLDAGTATRFDAGITGIEHVTGGDGADTLAGDAGDNTILGGAGADSIAGGGGDDDLQGEAGDDTLDGGTGNDDLDGGDDDDTFLFDNDSEDDTINGGDGTDDTADLSAVTNTVTFVPTTTDGTFEITDTGGVDVDATNVENVVGGAETDDLIDYSAFTGDVSVALGGAATGVTGTVSGFEQVTGGAGDDTLVGTSGDDVLEGGDGDDSISGGDGADTLQGDAGDDTLVGGAGDDTFLYPDAAFDADTVTEGSAGGTDTLDLSAYSGDLTFTIGSVNVDDGAGNTVDHGDDNVEALIGGDGDDTFAFSDGAVLAGGDGTIDGGGGNNTIDYSDYASAVTVDLGTPGPAFATDPTIEGEASGVAGLKNIQNATGGAGDDVLTGDDDDNTLIGFTGNDTLDGLDGDDELFGGVGDDLFLFTEAAWGSDNVNEAPGEGDDTMDFSAQTSDLTVTLGTITVNDGGFAQHVDDNVENLILGPGDDDITFDAEGDVLPGTLDAGAGTDTLNYENYTSDVTVNLITGAATAINGGAAGSLSGVENVTGGDGDDTFTGDDNDNVLNGGNGDDTFVFVGAAWGDDTVDGDDDEDTLDFSQATNTNALDPDTGVTVDLGAGTATDANDPANTVDLSNIENVTGTDLNDTLTGDTDSNVLDGGAGNDVLDDGGSGLDYLIGGDGDDTLMSEEDDDTLDGGAGDDLYDIEADGNVTLLDASGNDTITFDRSTSGITFDANDNDGTNDQALGGGPTLNVTGEIENLVGSPQADNLTILPGGTVNGNGGGDTLNGSAGDDVFTIDSSLDAAITITGGAGTDQLIVLGDDAVDDSIGIAADGTITYNGADVTIADDGFQTVDVFGLDGDDTLQVDGNPAEFTGGITFDGGLPTASDGLVLYAPAGEAVTLDFATNTGTIDGGVPIVTTGVETVTITGTDGTADDVDVSNYGTNSDINTLNVDGGDTDDDDGDALDIGFTGADDVVVYEPGDPNAGTSTLTNDVGDPGVNIAEVNIRQFSSATVTIDTGAGTDGVTVDGTDDDDAIAITDDGANVRVAITQDVDGANNPLLPIVVATANASLTIDAADDDDTFTPTQTNATVHIDGEGGDDLLDYSGQTAPVIVDLSGQDLPAPDDFGTGSAAAGVIGPVTTDSIEDVTGGSGDDTLTGDRDDNVLLGGDGNDVLNGNDLTDIADGDDTLDGGDGNDTLNGSFGDDVLTGGDNDDLLDGGTGDDTLTGNDGDDTYTFDNNFSDAGGDVVVEAPGEGTDTLDFSADSEDLTITFGSTTVTSNDSNDNLFSATDDVESILGGSGDDTFVMNDDGSGGVEDKPVSVDGGAGLDALDYTNPAITTGVNVDLSTGVNPGVAAIASIEGVNGSAQADTITGTTGNDSLVGNGGDDTINGLAGNDTLRGDAGDDELNGSTGDDTYEFDAIPNVGGGNEETDTVNENAGEGTDTFDFARIEAPGEDDWVDADLNAGGDIVQMDLGGPVLTPVRISRTIAVSDNTNIENVVGGENDDEIIGNDADNVLEGNDGDDEILGGPGNDTLQGNDGNDELEGNDGDDVLEGNDGDDDLSGDDGDDTLEGNDGDDELSGDAGDDVLDGGDQDDTLFGGLNNDILDGGADDDDLSGGQGDDTLTGNTGDDLLEGGGDDDLYLFQAGWGSDTLNEGVDEGTDIVDYSALTTPLTFAVGSLTVTDGLGNSLFSAGDTVVGIIGGTAVDTLSYAGFGSPATVDLGAGTATGLLSVTGVENVTGSGSSDSITGDAGPNVLIGGGFDDTLAGGAGNDTLQGDEGDDVIDGGDGMDQISFAGSAEAIAIRIDDGTSNDGENHRNRGSLIFPDSSSTNNGIDTYANIEGVIGTAFDDVVVGGNSTTGYVIDGGLGNDVLIGGDAGDDTIDGQGGSDVVIGLGGDDELMGSGGRDTLLAGAGTDDLTGGTDEDWYVFEDGFGVNTINEDSEAFFTGDQDTISFGGFSVSVDLATLTLLDLTDDDFTFDPATADINFAIASITATDGAGNSVTADDNVEAIVGGDGTDTVDYSGFGAPATVDLGAGTGTANTTPGTIGIAGVENILGSANDDVLTGDGGDNVIEGGAGDDTIDGAGGSDTLSHAADTAGVTVDLTAGTATGGATGTDTVANFENLAGGGGNDDLTGDATTTFFASGGTDTLDGGGGTLDLSDQTDPVAVDLGAGTASGTGFTMAVSNFVTVLGGSGDDDITGDAGANVLDGGDGADTLSGGDGDDELLGGAGADELNGDGDDDLLDGGDDADALDGGAGSDTLLGGLGDDALDGGAGDDTLNGGLGDDALDGGTGTDLADYELSTADLTVDLTGGTASGADIGNDTVTGVEDVNTGGGDDDITGSTADNTIDAGEGDNTVAGGTGDDAITAGAGDDVLDGGLGDDTTDGGDGDDTYNVEPGSDDVIVDSSGTDGVFFSDANLGISVNLDQDSGQVQVLDSAGNTLAITGVIEEVGGSPFADTIEGTDLMILPSGGSDTVMVDGGTLDFSGETGPRGINVRLADNGRTSTARDSHNNRISIEGIDHIIGSPGNDRISGNNADNVIDGGGGNDRIDGRGGNDVLTGNEGQLRGGDGDDLLMGFGGGDRLRADGGRGDDILDFGGAFERSTFTGGADDDSLDLNIDGHRNRADGGAGDDVLVFEGVGDNLQIRGGSGNDSLSIDLAGNRGRVDGGGGDDAIDILTFDDGDLGRGSVSGGGGRDLLSFEALASASGVYANLTRRMAETTANDDLCIPSIRTIEDLFGTPFDDILVGDRGVNGLFGHDGDDQLDGGRGADVLDGGFNDSHPTGADLLPIGPGDFAVLDADDVITRVTNDPLGDLPTIESFGPSILN